MVKPTRLAGALALASMLWGCGAPAPATISSTGTPPVSAGAVDLATLLAGLQRVEQNLPQGLAAAPALIATIERIKAQASQPFSLATAQTIAQGVAALAPFANLIPPPYGQMIAAAATLAPVIVEEAGAVGSVVAALAPAPGAMTPSEARAILAQLGSP